MLLPLSGETTHEHTFLAALAKLSATPGKSAAAEVPEAQPKTVTVNGFRCMPGPPARILW